MCQAAGDIYGKGAGRQVALDLFSMLVITSYQNGKLLDREIRIGKYLKSEVEVNLVWGIDTKWQILSLNIFHRKWVNIAVCKYSKLWKKQKWVISIESEYFCCPHCSSNFFCQVIEFAYLSGQNNGFSEPNQRKTRLENERGQRMFCSRPRCSQLYFGLDRNVFIKGGVGVFLLLLLS